ncbi:MAG: HipA N-terminal domain-containing protein [Ignavibacteriaceae bacterium]|nr:HipA N-terminal domain-containing protein [Ignavibacteriaceae bacterium]
MSRANVFNFGKLCGHLEEIKRSKEYKFSYLENYQGKPISLTMPVEKKNYLYNEFPPFFDGLLPEGFNLNALCRKLKIDKDDSFQQLLVVGKDVVGSVTVEPEDE